MQTEQHVRENGIVKNTMKIFGIHVAYGRCAGIAAHGQALAFVDLHEAAEEWSFAQIVLR